VRLDRGYSPINGWNPFANEYRCPPGSHFYLYKVLDGGENYILAGVIEDNSGRWEGEADWGDFRSWAGDPPCTGSGCALNFGLQTGNDFSPAKCIANDLNDGCPSNCTYRDDLDCGCNSVDYDGSCNEDIGCNKDNDLDCRRLVEIPDDLGVELPRVKITSKSLDLDKWWNHDLKLEIKCYSGEGLGDCPSSVETYLKKVGSSEACPRTQLGFSPSDDPTATEDSYWCAAGYAGIGLGVAPKIEIKIDKILPIISSFYSPQKTTTITPPVCVGEDTRVKLNWSASDTGGSGLDKVKVWRTTLTDDACDDWGDSPLAEVAGSVVTFLYDPITKLPDTGNGYCYGIHAIDGAGNLIYESTPIKVKVVDCSPKTLTLTKNNQYYGWSSAQGFDSESNSKTLKCESSSCGGLTSVEAAFRYGGDDGTVVNLDSQNTDEKDAIFDYWTGILKSECPIGSWISDSGKCTQSAVAVTMLADRKVSANFSLIEHKVTFVKPIGGSIEISKVAHPVVAVSSSALPDEISSTSSYTLRNRTSFELNAKALEDVSSGYYKFDHWKVTYGDGHEDRINSSSPSIMMKQDVIVEAVFNKLYALCLDVSPTTSPALGSISNTTEDDLADDYAGLCETSCGMKDCFVYQNNKEVVLNAGEYTNGHFVDWTGACAGSTAPSCSFNLIGYMNVTANFEKIIRLKLTGDLDKITSYNASATEEDLSCEYADCFSYPESAIFSIKDIELKKGYRIANWTRNWGSEDEQDLKPCDEAWDEKQCLNIRLGSPSDGGMSEIEIETRKYHTLDIEKTGSGASLANYSLSKDPLCGDGFSACGAYSGTITNSVKYDEGDSITISLVDKSLLIDSVVWTEIVSGGDSRQICEGADSCTVVINADKKIGIELKKKFRVVASVDPSGGGTVILGDYSSTSSCTRDYSEGSNVSITADRLTGSEWGFERWSSLSSSLPCAGEIESSPCQINNILSDHAVTAKFKDDTWPVITAFTINKTCFDSSLEEIEINLDVTDFGNGINCDAKSIEIWQQTGGGSWIEMTPYGPGESYPFLVINPSSISNGCRFEIIDRKYNTSSGSSAYGVHIKDRTGNCITENGYDCSDGHPETMIRVSDIRTPRTTYEPFEINICSDGCDDAGECIIPCALGEILDASDGLCKAGKYVFVTGSSPVGSHGVTASSMGADGTTQGNITATVSGVDYVGYRAADEICNALAEKISGISNEFKPSHEANYRAWLSGGDGIGDNPIYSPILTSVSGSLVAVSWLDPAGDKPYYLINGTKVSNNNPDLLDGSLNHAINLSNLKTPISGTVWTGTNYSGIKHYVAGSSKGPSRLDLQCGYWDTTAGNAYGDSHSGTGSSGVSSLIWTKDAGGPANNNCNSYKHLYCFQDVMGTR
jgi:hypothetical protein